MLLAAHMLHLMAVTKLYTSLDLLKLLPLYEDINIWPSPQNGQDAVEKRRFMVILDL